MVCRFCGEEVAPDDLLHVLTCNGRQGQVEALYGRMGDVPFESASDTSAAAAATLDQDELSRLEAVVFDAIVTRPQTCDAIEAATGLSHQTASARIRGLVLRDRVKDSGQRATTRSGRRAVVWCAVSRDDA